MEHVRRSHRTCLFFQIKLHQVDLIAELKKRQVSPQVREGKDGAIEDIITGNTPTTTPQVALLSTHKPEPGSGW